MHIATTSPYYSRDFSTPVDSAPVGLRFASANTSTVRVDLFFPCSFPVQQSAETYEATANFYTGGCRVQQVRSPKHQTTGYGHSYGGLMLGVHHVLLTVASKGPQQHGWLLTIVDGQVL